MFTRTESLLGKNATDKLKNSHIVICGVGGVGSYTLEALVRCGVGKITIIDADKVDKTNINRQIIATNDTVGQLKVLVAKQRCEQISKSITVNTVAEFLTRDNIEQLMPKDASYIVDAIDYVPAKIGLCVFANKNKVPIISCLGTANRLDASKFEICDIYKTSGCPLARKMRYELKKEGAPPLNVIFSKAKVIDCDCLGSVSFVPSVAGLLAAQKVVLDIVGDKNEA